MKMGRKVKPGRKHRIEGGGIGDAPEPPIILDYANVYMTDTWLFYNQEFGGELMSYHILTSNQCDLVDHILSSGDAILIQRKGGQAGKWQDVKRMQWQVDCPDVEMLSGSLWIKSGQIDVAFGIVACITGYLAGLSHATTDWADGVGMPTTPAVLLSDTTYALSAIVENNWYEFPLNAAGLLLLQAAQNGSFFFTTSATAYVGPTEPTWTEDPFKARWNVYGPTTSVENRPYLRYGFAI